KGVLQEIISRRSAFGLYGMAALASTAASLFTSVRAVVNRIYRITPSKLVVVTFLENMLLVVVVGLLFIIANAFTWTLTFLDSLLQAIPGIVDLPSTTKFIQSI